MSESVSLNFISKGSFKLNHNNFGYSRMMMLPKRRKYNDKNISLKFYF